MSSCPITFNKKATPKQTHLDFPILEGSTFSRELSPLITFADFTPEVELPSYITMVDKVYKQTPQTSQTQGLQVSHLINEADVITYLCTFITTTHNTVCWIEMIDWTQRFHNQKYWGRFTHH